MRHTRDVEQPQCLPGTSHELLASCLACTIALLPAACTTVTTTSFSKHLLSNLHAPAALPVPAAVHDMLASARPVSGDKYSEADWNSTSQLASEPYWLSKVGAGLAWHTRGLLQGRLVD